MLLLEECRGWEYIAVRGLGTKRRFFASPPPDSSASFSRSWFRVLEFGKRCYSSYLFLLQCFLCLPSPTTLCSYKPWVEVDVFFLYFCVLSSCPPLSVAGSCRIWIVDISVLLCWQGDRQHWRYQRYQQSLEESQRSLTFGIACLLPTKIINSCFAERV